MRILAKMDEKYKEIELHVCHDEMDSEVTDILRELHTLFDRSLAGTDAMGNKCLLQPGNLYSFYAEGQKVFALDETEKYTIPQKLYELEDALSSYGFVRISKSEIINLKKVKRLDLGTTGTIKVILKNGYETYASRRNVVKIKNLLVKEGKQ